MRNYAGESCLPEAAIPSVYVAGDCRTKAIRQVTTATADGAVAALAACRYPVECDVKRSLALSQGWGFFSLCYLLESNSSFIYH